MNRKTATYFLTDSRNFLVRYKALVEISTCIGLRSKLLVEFLFATECALKSLIFIESTEGKKKTYKRVRKLSHKIDSLIFILNIDSQKNYKEIIRTDLDEYQIYPLGIDKRRGFLVNICK